MTATFRFMTLTAPILLAACVAPQGDYPSLAMRDVERVSGTMTPGPAPPPPPAPTPATLAELDQHAAAARAAHTRFREAAPAVDRMTAAARGSANGSDSWSAAQVALADLEARRSSAMIALADLDRIYVAAATESQDVTRIAAVRDEVAGLVEAENALVASLLARLAP